MRNPRGNAVSGFAGHAAACSVLAWGMMQSPAALAAISLDPEIHLASRYSQAWVDAKRVGTGTRWQDYDSYTDDGSLADVVINLENWGGSASAYADYGRSGVAGFVDISGDAYSYGGAHGLARTTDYMVLSAIVPGSVPTITNIAEYSFLIHGRVPTVHADDGSIVDAARLVVDVLFYTGHGTFYAYESVEFDAPTGQYTKLLSGSFTFDLDEVIRVETKLYLDAFIRPSPDLKPDDAPWNWEQSLPANGIINMQFDSTVAFTGLVLPDGVMLAATASGAGYPVEYTPAPVPAPAALPLLGSALLGLYGVRRRGTVRSRAQADPQQSAAKQPQPAFDAGARGPTRMRA